MIRIVLVGILSAVVLFGSPPCRVRAFELDQANSISSSNDRTDQHRRLDRLWEECREILSAPLGSDVRELDIRTRRLEALRKRWLEIQSESVSDAEPLIDSDKTPTPETGIGREDAPVTAKPRPPGRPCTACSGTGWRVPCPDDDCVNGWYTNAAFDRRICEKCCGADRISCKRCSSILQMINNWRGSGFEPYP